MRTSLPLGTLMAVAVRALQAGTFFVSPPGDDANPGTEAEPFATLSRAQAAVRQAKGAGPVTVFLRGGTYYLSETLVFTAEDSGTANAPVSWQAWQDEQPVISGGAKLALKWEAFRDGIMKARVPAGFTTDQLFVNGERQILARYPNFDPNVRILNGYSKDAFGPDRAARWADPRGGFIHAMHAHLWGDFHYLITGKDVEGQLTYEGGWQNNRRLGMHKEFRFVENIFEELDAPGEWFLDAKASMLYFHPPAGLDLARATVEGVRLRHLIEFRGAEARPVKFISLKGLTFRHAARTFMDNKEPLLRSDWTTYRGGAVFFNGAEDCALEECVLDQLGGNAIFINNYNRRLTIRGCEIAKAGANGVAFVGDPNAVRSPLFEYNQVQELAKLDRTPGPKSRNYPADCRVEDCLIHLTGRVEKQTAAVQIAMAQDITVRQCSIYDVPRAGINIGDGCWGGHVIEFCDVFDTVKETGDHGSFNSWGRDRYWRPSIEEVNAWVKAAPDLPLLDTVKPVILRHNRWRCDHGWDIDLDDGSSNYEIRNNLCLNGGLKNREGFHRVVENNVIVNNSFHPHVWYAESQDIFRRNIVFGGYQPIRVNKPWGRECDFNLVHQPGADDERPATKLQEQSGRDERSILAGALFVDAGRGDYRVKDGSPALKLGFQNFPMDQFGVQSPKLKARARTPELPALKPKSTGDAGKRDGRVVDSVCKPPALPEDSSSLTVPGSRSAPGATRLALPLTPPLSRRERENVSQRFLTTEALDFSETVCRCSLSPGERGGVRGKRTLAELALGLSPASRKGWLRLQAAHAFKPPAFPELADRLGGKIKRVVVLGEFPTAGVPGETGVSIVAAPADSQLAKAGLREGDVVLKCSDRDTSTVDDFLQAFRAAPPGGKLRLEILRSQQRTKLELSVPATPSGGRI